MATAEPRCVEPRIGFLVKQEVKLRRTIAAQGQRISSCVQVLTQTPNGCCSDHPATEAIDSESQLRFIDLADAVSHQAQKALDSIYDRTYGTCEDCGEKIVHKRLTVFPAASRCVSCQEKWESSPRATI